MSCSGDSLANSAQLIDRDQLSRGERWLVPDRVSLPLIGGTLATKGAHLTCQGGSLPGTEQVARMPRLRPGRRRGGGGGGRRRRDGWTVTKTVGVMGYKKSNQATDDFLNPIFRHRVPDRSRKEFLISRLRSLPPCHHTPTSKSLLNPGFSVY